MKQQTLTPQSTRDSFSKAMTSALLRLNQSRAREHLCFFQDLFHKYGFDATLRTYPNVDFMQPSFIDEAWFTRVKDHRNKTLGFHYRLKPGVSASEALDHILNHGITFLECKTGLVLAHYFALLDLLQQQWGKQKGAHYFDRLFGSKDREVPIYRRLLISNDGEIGAKYLFYPTNFVNPVCYFLGYADRVVEIAAKMKADPNYEIDEGTEGKRNLPLGSSCVFLNNLALFKGKHSEFATANCYNAVLAKHHDTLGDLYLVFGFDKFLTEGQLHQKLVDELNKPADETSQRLVALYKREALQQIPLVKKSQVDGFIMGGTIDIHLKRLNGMLATEDADIIAAKLDAHLVSERKVAFQQLVANSKEDFSLQRALVLIVECHRTKNNPEFETLPDLPEIKELLDQSYQGDQVMPFFQQFNLAMLPPDIRDQVLAFQQLK